MDRRAPSNLQEALNDGERHRVRELTAMISDGADRRADLMRGSLMESKRGQDLGMVSGESGCARRLTQVPQKYCTEDSVHVGTWSGERSRPDWGVGSGGQLPPNGFVCRVEHNRRHVDTHEAQPVCHFAFAAP